MAVSVLLLMLGSAALNAGWNAVVKGAEHKLYMTILMTGGAGLVGALVLPFLPAPARAGWPFIAASAGCSIGYYVLVAQAYREGDLSLVFPLMRGTAPLLVALGSQLVLGERLSPATWLGVGLICGGILCLAATALGQRSRGAGFALANALVIAVYTSIDGLGVRRSGAPLAYALWIYLLTGLPLVAWALVRDRAGFVRYVAARRLLGTLGGGVAVITYVTTLWAMTVAPVAVVAALRESSILFATLLSAWVLKERVDVRRMVMVGAIAGGAMVLRLG
jgi:drug/metabolite transporter (DMT)-like permease